MTLPEVHIQCGVALRYSPTLGGKTLITCRVSPDWLKENLIAFAKMLRHGDNLQIAAEVFAREALRESEEEPE